MREAKHSHSQWGTYRTEQLPSSMHANCCVTCGASEARTLAWAATLLRATCVALRGRTLAAAMRAPSRWWTVNDRIGAGAGACTSERDHCAVRRPLLHGSCRIQRTSSLVLLSRWGWAAEADATFWLLLSHVMHASTSPDLSPVRELETNCKPGADLQISAMTQSKHERHGEQTQRRER
jgi:hypothetical protein